MILRIFTIAFGTVLLFALSQSTHAIPFVEFVEPVNGAAVVSPFKVKFAVNEMRVSPVGDMSPGTGHHHLLLNQDSIPEGQIIPMDDEHLHFGKGQTETIVELPPGRHQLVLQFGNGAHQSYGPGLSQAINIIVK